MREVTSIKTATLLNAAAKYTNVIFNLLATSILARILSPEDYGVVAVVTVFSTFFLLFADIGLGSGIIQNKDLNDDDISNIFSFTIYLGLALMVLFILCSYPISLWYGDSVYFTLGVCLSFSLFFNAINMIPNALLQKEKQFVVIAIRTVVVALISYGVAIALALLGWRYYALVFQSIVSAFLAFAWNYRSVKLRIHLRFNYNSIKKILNYSIFNFAYEVLNYFGRNLDNLLTGKFIGKVALGYYNKAYNLMLYPVSYLTYAITPVLHPILSDYQNERKTIYDNYIRIFKVLSLLGTFFSVYCYFAAEEVILILYGRQWQSAIPCVRALSISIWFQMTAASCTSVFKSLGDSKTRFYSGVIYVPIQIVCIVIGIIVGNIEILSIFVAVSFIVRFVIEYYFLIRRCLHESLVKFYRDLLPELSMVLVMSVIMILIKRIDVDHVIISALIKGLACGITYLIMLFLTGQYRYLLSLVPKKWRK